MSVWQVATVRDTTKRVEADVYRVSETGYLEFFTDSKCVAAFASGQWLYLMKDKPAEVPMCNPKTSPGVIG